MAVPLHAERMELKPSDFPLRLASVIRRQLLSRWYMQDKESNGDMGGSYKSVEGWLTWLAASLKGILPHRGQPRGQGL